MKVWQVIERGRCGDPDNTLGTYSTEDSAHRHAIEFGRAELERRGRRDEYRTDAAIESWIRYLYNIDPVEVED